MILMLKATFGELVTWPFWNERIRNGIKLPVLKNVGIGMIVQYRDHICAE